MSVLRTPPPQSPSASPTGLEIPNLKVTQLSSEMSHHDTDCSTEPRSSNPKQSIRKRKRSHTAEGMIASFTTDMRKMFEDFKNEQDMKYDKLCATVEELRSPIDFLANRFDLLQTKVTQLDKDRQENLEYIKSLEEKVDSFERYHRSTCIELRNIPVQQGETKANLVSAVEKIGKTLKIEIPPNQIRDVYRIKTRNPAVKTIILDLNSVLLKEQIINMNRNFHKGGSKLTTEHLKITGAAVPIFISENLSPKMKKLFFQAREFAKANNYRYCWVSHGKIFLRKSDNGPLIRIMQETDLSNLLIKD